MITHGNAIVIRSNMWQLALLAVVIRCSAIDDYGPAWACNDNALAIHRHIR